MIRHVATAVLETINMGGFILAVYFETSLNLSYSEFVLSFGRARLMNFYDSLEHEWTGLEIITEQWERLVNWTIGERIEI